VDRGPHPSATAEAEFLFEEVFEMCQRRHAMVLPFSAVKRLRGVRVSPPGVVPQRGRRPRTICDLTFSGVNADTVNLAHPEAMQFGNALRRLLYQIYRADPTWGPVYLSKVDIKDGFYNVCVNANGVKKFGIVLPASPGQEPLILFFLGLPMGWISSPAVFCAATETIADVAQGKMDANWHPPPHRQDTAADTPTPDPRPPSIPGRSPRIQHRRKGPLKKIDCYVDDLVALAQGSNRRLRRLRRVLFHCIDMVFRAPDEWDDEWKMDPISVKKLLKGDGSWETTKVVLGWLVDTVAGTIELPPHRVTRLHEMLAAFPRTRRTCSKKDLQKLVGELRSMVVAIPGGIGCMSWLQDQLKGAKDRVYLNRHFKDAIDDFRLLADDVCSRPTRIAEIMPEPPLHVGCCDAARQGMGGVWLPDALDLYVASLGKNFAPVRDTSRKEQAARALAQVGERPLLPTSDDHLWSAPPSTAEVGSRARVHSAVGGEMTANLPPTLWRSKFPSQISEQLVSWENPDGAITNSDLELAGTLGHNIVLSQLTDLMETTTATGTDNTPAQSWSSKKAVSSTGPASYLLRLQAMHQRTHRYQSRLFFVPGVANKMADDCSRLWHLSDSDLVAYFNATYPQSEPWQLCHLDPPAAAAIVSALSCIRQPLPEFQRELMEHVSGGSTPPGSTTDHWHTAVPPSIHGLRKNLFESLARRPKSWSSNSRGLTVARAEEV